MAARITGKLLVGAIVLTALVAGGGVYYSAVYAYYEPVIATGTDDVQLTSLATDLPETILYEDFEAIDAASSPLKYRACFTTPTSLDTLSETYAGYPNAAPRVAPGWFSCFDAETIGTELAAGRAKAFLGARNLEYGIDRVVAVTQDGQGYVWHEVNDCGEKTYDGSPVDPTCPERP